ncbi:MAG: MBL fold metallo-hydrolase [Planctomycetes bacterium]|nr:MBL fold metallo-hydrolase [Planctomycetota bacterium]
MITVGRFQIASVINGRFGLDGGAMFGVVPKVLWERKAKPDDQNRIPLAMRTLVAVDAEAGRVILVDTGAGHKWPADEADRFAINPDPTALGQALAVRGLTEADVTDVVITHLHFDHNGGLTEWAEGSATSTRLRFPRARHWIHEKHWQHANSPAEKDRASFLKRDLEALADPEVLTLVTGEQPDPPFVGLHWQLSHGHTPYQLLPVFEGTDGDLLFVGDMIPTANHLPVPWVMAYDLEPLVTMAEKTRTLGRCGRNGLALAFPHDPDLGGVTVELIEKKPIIKQRLDL